MNVFGGYATPEMHSIFEVGSEQLRYFNIQKIFRKTADVRQVI